MSLINDALKRTQEAEQGRPLPTPELPLRPAEEKPPQPVEAGSAAKRFLLVMVLVVVGLNLALWLMFKDKDSAAHARARTESAQPAVPAVTAEPARPVEPVEAPAEPATNTVEAPVLPALPVLRLQSVLAHPKRPSAMINGTVVFVGDEVEGFTIHKIGQKSAVLRKDSEELVLTLP